MRSLSEVEVGRIERAMELELGAALIWAARRGGPERRYAVALLARRLDRSAAEVELTLMDLEHGNGE